MSVPVCHRLSFAVAETPAIAMRFMAAPEEARLLESGIRSQVDPALVSLDVVAEEGQAIAASVMVKAVLDSLPDGEVSLAESVDRDQLVNVALKLDFCVAMARDIRDPPPRLGEVVVRFRRGAEGVPGGGHEAFRVTMTDPAADQDTNALVDLFTRALSCVLVTHRHGSGLSVSQQAAPEPVGSARDALVRLLRELDAAGLAGHADQVQAAFPDGAVDASDEAALAA